MSFPFNVYSLNILLKVSDSKFANNVEFTKNINIKINLFIKKFFIFINSPLKNYLPNFLPLHKQYFAKNLYTKIFLSYLPN